MQPVEFLNWDLTKEEKIAAKAYEVTLEALMGMLEGLVDDGYRISFKRDDYNKCFNCSFTEAPRVDGSPARCIVSRGPTVGDAVRVACFKHFVLLEGDWGKISAATLAADVWG
jgi:hypothetical protein